MNLYYTFKINLQVLIAINVKYSLLTFSDITDRTCYTIIVML